MTGERKTRNTGWAGWRKRQRNKEDEQALMTTLVEANVVIMQRELKEKAQTNVMYEFFNAGKGLGGVGVGGS